MSSKTRVENSNEDNASYTGLSRKSVLGTLSIGALNLALSGCAQLNIQLGDFTNMQGYHEDRKEEGIVDGNPKIGMIQEFCMLGDYINTAGQPRDRKEEVIVDGNPEVGTVYYIGQVHKLSIDAEDYKKEAIANFQLRILVELERLALDHVFDESQSRDEHEAQPSCRPKDSQPYDHVHTEMIKTYIGSLTHPTLKPYLTDIERYSHRELSIEYLYHAGGAHLYRYFNPSANIHGTSSYEESKEVYERYKANGLKDTSFFLYTREKWATREIMSFLKRDCENGKRVGLVYGMAHDFADDFKGCENPPRVISISFPALEETIYGVENPMEKWGIKKQSKR